jgi:D-3-phosphoglycerate dehydrogenase
MKEILTLNKISPVIDEVFDDNYTVAADVANPDGILLRSFNMADYAVGDKLVAIGRAGAGVNNIPVKDMSEKGIVVFNTPGANANAVKELTLCGMLMACRDVIGGNKWVNTLTGDDVAKQAEKGKSNFAGIEIAGKTLGVVGLGAIGRAVADACKALGMNVVGYDPYLPAGVVLDYPVVDLDTLYQKSDFITLHVPLLDATRGMINQESIAKMKDGVILLNIARGELANTTALKEAVAAGKIAKYVVDFPSADLLNTPNVLVLPHLGASTEEAENNCAKMAAEQLKDYIENGNIRNSVNFPACGMQRMTPYRIVILHRNIANSLAQITAVVGNEGINISNLSNQSRGEYAVTVLDVDNEVSANDLERIAQVKGILKVRFLH